MCESHRHLGATTGKSLDMPRADIRELADRPLADKRPNPGVGNMPRLAAPQSENTIVRAPDISPSALRELVKGAVIKAASGDKPR